MNRPDKAEELFRKGYNCSQSTFAAFADVLGMTVEEAAKIASPFGAGFGKLREVCGAVSGMTLLAGYLNGYDDPADYESKKELYRLIQRMCADFEESRGTIISSYAGNCSALRKGKTWGNLQCAQKSTIRADRASVRAELRQRSLKDICCNGRTTGREIGIT